MLIRCRHTALDVVFGSVPIRRVEGRAPVRETGYFATITRNKRHRPLCRPRFLNVRRVFFRFTFPDFFTRCHSHLLYLVGLSVCVCGNRISMNHSIVDMSQFSRLCRSCVCRHIDGCQAVFLRSGRGSRSTRLHD